ncbi:MAG: hypothetical protein M4D80_23375 [Myxococcota bacterium]|nr:hypothetical protein [Deltaproteobacteria bacterium]MDQ3338118.1 hypothetical protein [Myxococcota bacterium]
MTLLAVAGLAGAAHAAPDAPRALPTGAPACGNVMSKYGVLRGEDLLCPVFRNLRDLEELGRNYDAELRKLAGMTTPLTLPAEPRPRL